MDPIHDGRIPLDIQKTYRQEFSQGVKLFQASLSEYENTTDENKKARFKDVMDKALHAMNEAARGFLGPKSQEVQTHLQTDYQAFLNNDTPETYKKLNNDLNHLKSIG